MRAHPNASRQSEPPAHERLRKLAREVEQLGTSGRLDPEQIVVAKLSIAQDMRRLAGELEAGR